MKKEHIDYEVYESEAYQLKQYLEYLTSEEEKSSVTLRDIELNLLQLKQYLEDQAETEYFAKLYVLELYVLIESVEYYLRENS